MRGMKHRQAQLFGFLLFGNGLAINKSRTISDAPHFVRTPEQPSAIFFWSHGLSDCPASFSPLFYPSIGVATVRLHKKLGFRRAAERSLSEMPDLEFNLLTKLLV
ncbi:hypothetical protein C8R47DRAFT_494966 [Mycena vitilis]|nr:hypothetical protein C8R47DRAFT_494966 [Mycena vitilis]